MGNLSLKKLNRYLLTAIIAVFILSAVGFIFTARPFARAENSSVERHLPSSALEYKSLKSPIDVYSDDMVTAIVQSPDNAATSLLLYLNGEYSQIDCSALKQVKKLDDQTLLALSNAKVYSINLSSKQRIPFLATDNDQISGNFFDLNDNYLVTAFGTDAYVYEKTIDGYAKKGEFKVLNNSPIAINEKNEIFYIDADEFLWRTNADNSVKVKISQNKIVENAVLPTKMIADSNYVYCVQSQKIRRISVADNVVTDLFDDGKNVEFNLGNLKNPTGVAFKNGNLLVTDATLNAVQEFSVNSLNKLEFTGFAIASGQSAYNRVSSAVKDVEKLGNSVALLDDKQLIINTPVSENRYARENYKNLLVDDFGDKMPDAFALGNNTALLVFSVNTTDSYVKLLKMDEQISLSDVNLNSPIVRDVCYQSGIYYILADNGSSSCVYSLIETNAGEPNKLIDLNTTSISAFSCMTVDVFKNVYLANYDSGDIFVYSNKDNFTPLKVATQQGVTKMNTDLGGRLYLLANGELKMLNGGSLVDVTPTLLTENDKIKSFAMAFDKKEIYFTINGEELVCTTNALNNYALSDATANDDNYKLTATTTQIDNLNIATVNDDANVYSVKRNGQGFTYKKLITPENEYAVICDVIFGNDLRLCALAGQKGIVLVNANEITIISPERASAPQKAFVTTNVNAYYFPIITSNGDYSLTEQQPITINKGCEISPVCKIKVLDKEFYFASVTIGGKEISGYIPVSFTAETLTEDFKWDEYSIVELNKTAFFSDSALTNKICDVKKGQQVRLISIDDGVARVAIKIDQTYTFGFVKESAIDDAPSRAIRNLLIILAVSAAVCGSLSYFLMRKKG